MVALLFSTWPAAPAAQCVQLVDYKQSNLGAVDVATSLQRLKMLWAVALDEL